MTVKYFSKKPKSATPTKQFSEDSTIDASVVKTLCGVVDGLQAKVAEMSDELAKLKETDSKVVQNASTEEGEHIPEPAGDPVQPPQQIPEEVANGVADDKPAEYSVVTEDKVVSQFSNKPATEEKSSVKQLMGQETFSCLFD